MANRNCDKRRGAEPYRLITLISYKLIGGEQGIDCDMVKSSSLLQ